MTIQTNDRYWDCECETEYIHRKQVRLTCPRCGASESDGMPDSRVFEVLDGRYFAPVNADERRKFITLVLEAAKERWPKATVEEVMAYTAEMPERELFSEIYMIFEAD